MPGTLYLVATPIGNLEDISRRALDVLSEVDLIACEDTRRTRVLLDHFGIKTKTISYHEHNEKDRAGELSAMLGGGRSVAVVSDAGTPGIADPGFRVVNEALSVGAAVIPIPGAVAFISALVASGLPTDQFFFGGFLPSKAQARRAKLEEVRTLQATLVFYETPHRIAQALADAREVLGERNGAVARELTKLHEEIARGSLSELEARFAPGESHRGEMVLIIDRNEIVTSAPPQADILRLVENYENAGMDHRAALKRVARELGLSRDEAYRRLVELRARRARG